MDGTTILHIGMPGENGGYDSLQRHNGGTMVPYVVNTFADLVGRFGGSRVEGLMLTQALANPE